jgi:hypothetical protein
LGQYQELGMIYVDPPGLYYSYSDSGFIGDFREDGEWKGWKTKIK